MSFLSTGLGALGLATGVGAAPAAAVSVLPNLFKSSAAGPNADAAKATWPEVLRNNLAAVAAFMARGPGNGPGTGIHTESSAQPWADGLQQIPATLQAQARLAFPTLNTSGAWEIFGAIPPENVLPTVQRLAVYATTPTTVTGGGPGGASVVTAVEEAGVAAANAAAASAANKTGVTQAVTEGGQQAAVQAVVKWGGIAAVVGLLIGATYFAATAHARA